MNTQLFINSYLEKIDGKFGFKSSNQAFEIFSIAAIIDKPFEDVHSEVSTLVKNNGEGFNGQNDGGIDGVYFDDASATLIVTQVKNSENLGDNEVTKFVADYQNLFERNNQSNIPLNDNIKAKLETINAQTSKGVTFTPKLFFVFNGVKKGQNKEVAERHQNANPYLEIWDAMDLYSRIDLLRSSQKSRKPISFTFNAERSNLSSPHNPQGIITFGKANVTAVSFRLKAAELCKLIEEEKSINRHTDHLYDQNVRGFLGNNRTNQQIRETLTSADAIYFPFLNNGITIIADKVTIPPPQVNQYPIQTLNPVIVNGLQSTQVIYDVFKEKPENLEDVDVMIRLYQTQDEGLAEKITTATNTQTSINVRDKMSNQDFNQWIKVLFENKGIGYVSKRGASFENDLSRGLPNVISSEVILKFWYATYNERPEIAKASKNQVLQQIYDASIDANEPLHILFNGDKNSQLYSQMLNVYKIHSVVSTKRSYATEDTPDFTHHADELIAYGIHKHLETKNNEAFGLSDNDLLKIYQEIFDKTHEISIEYNQKLNSLAKTYSHNNYFKSSQCRIDLNNKFNWVETF